MHSNKMLSETDIANFRKTSRRWLYMFEISVSSFHSANKWRITIDKKLMVVRKTTYKSLKVVNWLRYSRYGVKHQLLNHGITLNSHYGIFYIFVITWMKFYNGQLIDLFDRFYAVTTAYLIVQFSAKMYGK